MNYLFLPNRRKDQLNIVNSLYELNNFSIPSDELALKHAYKVNKKNR